MGKVLELYVCSICGVSNETCRQWGPICRKTESKVCATCCYHCEHHVSWSGIWRCSYITPELRKEQALKKKRASFDEEVQKISAAYSRKRRDEARQRAIKTTRARARRQRQNPGGVHNR